ncbi:MAG: hypothetical protein IJ017_02930 [Oscillospiraceae bacterium]|nr:hypothetical protein [Oscillospiraceae bacterium]
MKRIISTLLLLVLCCTLLTGCFCKHEWQDATCTTPTTCSLCGKTEGEAPGHMAGDMVTGEIDLAAKTSTSYQNCKICGTSLHSEVTDLTTFLDGGKFIFSPNQYNDAMNTYFGGEYIFEIDTLDSGALISMISDANGGVTGAIMYLANGDSLTIDDADSPACDSLLSYWYTDDNAQIIDVMTGILMGCDINLNEETALNTLSAIIDAYGSSYSSNGLSYEVTLNDNDFVFLISVD